MELKFFSHFFTTYLVVLTSIVGWFIVMIGQEKKISSRDRGEE